MKRTILVAMAMAACAGSAGKSGDAGTAGPQGATGAQGPAGATGAQGATGSQGATGLQGATGSTGASGVAAVSCPQGQYVNAIDAAGSATCVADQNTTYTNGSGILLSGNAFSLDVSAVQKPVTGACPGGSAIRSINADGSVSCGPFTTTVYVPGNGSGAAANGAALLSAIAHAGSVASPSTPYVVKLEPGIYDVGTDTFTVPAFVELAGTSATTTIILAEPSSGTGVAAGNNSIRDLRFQIGSNASNVQGLSLSSDTIVSNVTLSVACSNTSAVCVGVVSSDGSVFDDVGIDAVGGALAEAVTGDADLRRCTVTCRSTSSNTCIIAGPEGDSIDATTVTLSGPGIAFEDARNTGQTHIRNSTFSGPSSVFLTSSATVSFSNDILSGDFTTSGAAPAEVLGGRIQGNVTAANNSKVHLVGTLIQGTTAITPGSNIGCSNVTGTDGSTYTNYTSTCP